MTTAERRCATEPVIVEHRGSTMIITINRPDRRNALDANASAALSRAFRDLEGDPGLKVGVLTGADDMFCAGADLKALADGEVYEPWGADPDGPCHAPLAKPLIAAVEGHACAGGLGLALRCDLRVAASSARFAVLSRRWGVPMSDGTTVRLPRLIGQGRALDLLLTARSVAGAEAVAIGLADRLAEPGGALPLAVEMAELIAGFPAEAMLADRRSLYAGLALGEQEALVEEARISEAARLASPEGAGRFRAGAGRHGRLG